MKRPCADCPFSRKKFGYLHGDRVREIVDALRHGGRFPCHKTVDYDRPDHAQAATGEFCAGAMLYMERAYPEKGGAYMNQMVRIEAMLARRDIVAELDPDFPVFDNVEDMASHHENNEPGAPA